MTDDKKTDEPIEVPKLQLVDGLDTGPTEVMPVTEEKYLPTNLEACASDPLRMSPEAFAQLEHFYGGALNSSKCPCESGKMYRDCCKPMWQMARRAWQNKTDEVKQAHKEEVRRDMKAMEAEAKDAKHTVVIAELVVNTKDGSSGIRLVPNEQGHPPHYGFVAQLLLEGYGKMILKMTEQQTQNMIGQMLQQLAASSGQPAGDGPVSL